MSVAADSGIVTVEISITTIEQDVEVNRIQHGDVFVGTAFTAGVTVLNNLITLTLHHLGEAQRLACECTMRICLGVLGVKNTN